MLWQNEKLNKKAAKYVRENAVINARPNLHLLSGLMSPPFLTLHLSLGFHVKSVSRRLVNGLGFEVLTVQKGTSSTDTKDKM